MTKTKLTFPSYSFDEVEAQKAHDEWGSNCGPGALAAMLGLKPNDVHAHIPQFDLRHYVNPTMMKAALKSLGVEWTDNKAVSDPHQLTRYGLVRIQFEGPWTKPGVPPQAAYRETHWVGAMISSMGVRWVFDINSGWSLQQEWETKTVPELAAMNKRATGGWYATHRLELNWADEGKEECTSQTATSPKP